MPGLLASRSEPNLQYYRCCVVQRTRRPTAHALVLRASFYAKYWHIFLLPSQDSECTPIHRRMEARRRINSS